MDGSNFFLAQERLLRFALHCPIFSVRAVQLKIKCGFFKLSTIDRNMERHGRSICTSNRSNQDHFSSTEGGLKVHSSEAGVKECCSEPFTEGGWWRNWEGMTAVTVAYTQQHDSFN